MVWPLGNEAVMLELHSGSNSGLWLQSVYEGRARPTSLKTAVENSKLNAKPSASMEVS